MLNIIDEDVFFRRFGFVQELYMLLTWRDGRTAGPLRLDDAMAAEWG